MEDVSYDEERNGDEEDGDAGEDDASVFIAVSRFLLLLLLEGAGCCRGGRVSQDVCDALQRRGWVRYGL